MRKIYYVDLPQTSRMPFHEIAYTIGRILGYVALFAAGFVGGQVIRGLFLAFFG